MRRFLRNRFFRISDIPFISFTLGLTKVSLAHFIMTKFSSLDRFSFIRLSLLSIWLFTIPDMTEHEVVRDWQHSSDWWHDHSCREPNSLRDIPQIWGTNCKETIQTCVEAFWVSTHYKTHSAECSNNNAFIRNLESGQSVLITIS